MTPRLALNQITKAYPAVVANDKVDLTIMPGEIHAVLGENGAGKSTLMKIIFGVVKPDAGEILWNGVPVSIASPAAARQQGIGLVFQHFSLFDTLTVAENIALGLSEKVDLAELEQRIEQTAREYGLDLEPRRHVHTLSVGECQRVEIVRALLGKPQLLILDEPSNNLDFESQAQLIQALGAFKGAVLVVSHDAAFVGALEPTRRWELGADGGEVIDIPL